MPIKLPEDRQHKFQFFESYSDAIEKSGHPSVTTIQDLVMAIMREEFLPPADQNPCPLRTFIRQAKKNDEPLNWLLDPPAGEESAARKNLRARIEKAFENNPASALDPGRRVLSLTPKDKGDLIALLAWTIREAISNVGEWEERRLIADHLDHVEAVLEGKTLARYQIRSRANLLSILLPRVSVFLNSLDSNGKLFFRSQDERPLMPDDETKMRLAKDVVIGVAQSILRLRIPDPSNVDRVVVVLKGEEVTQINFFLRDATKKTSGKPAN